MANGLLFLNEDSRKFAGFNRRDSRYILLGAPLDVTSSFRPGTRYAPSQIRESAQFIEFLSLRTGIDVGEVGLNDLGDIVMHPTNQMESINRIKGVVGELPRGKFLITLGGEHTITQGVVAGLGNVDCLISFDAHLDLRDEYLGERFDHACAMRRIVEKGVKVVELGTRAVSREELEYARERGVKFFTSHEVRRLGVREIGKKVSEEIRECRRLYLSYDVDVFDPAYAPGVQTPEPEGLEPWTVLDIMNLFIDNRFVGMDVVEINPLVDPSGITSVLGAKLVLETLASHYLAAEKEQVR